MDHARVATPDDNTILEAYAAWATLSASDVDGTDQAHHLECKSREQNAFNCLVAAYQTPVRRIVLGRLKNHRHRDLATGTVEELPIKALLEVHEALLKHAREAAPLAKGLGPFIWGICRTEVFDTFRQSSRRREVPWDPTTPPAGSVPPEEAASAEKCLMNQQELLRLDEAIGTLPLALRKVAQRRFMDEGDPGEHSALQAALEGLPEPECKTARRVNSGAWAEELSKELELSPKSIYRLWNKALAQLKQALTGQGIDLEYAPWAAGTGVHSAVSVSEGQQPTHANTLRTQSLTEVRLRRENRQ